MKRLFSFFGSDIKEKGAEFLRKGFSEGYTLLALDASAIGIVAEQALPYTVIDDWIDSEAMLQVRESAVVCEREWFKAAKDKFTSDGVCWPEFDHHAMHWFWLDAILALAFVEAFKAGDVQEVRFFQSHSRRPAVYYSPSDVYSRIWETELPGIAKQYELNQLTYTKLLKTFLHRVFRYTRSRAGKVVRKITRWSTKTRPAVTPPSDLGGKVVFAFNPDEFHRFTPIIRQLCEALPGKVAAAILSPHQVTADKAAAEWSIPVICGPSSLLIDPGLQQQFLCGYAQALDAARGQPWQKFLKHLQFHFNYYCNQRWPKLAAGLHFWSELWQAANPKAVFVSSLLDSESQLPSQAAKCSGVPSFSVPHGAGVHRTIYVVASDYILYSLSTQRSLYERSDVPAHRLIACRDVIVENEYPAIPILMDSLSSAWRMLTITDPIGFSGCLAPSTSPAAQLEALQTLDKPPADIDRALSLNIKVHPNPHYSDLELFAATSEKLRKKILPVDTDLKSVLREVDLVVAVNYTGAALVHSLRAGKAVIFFWTDPLIAKIEPCAHADLYLPAVTLVRNPEGFWDLVRRFFTDPEAAEQMRLKAQEFCRSNLDDSSYPSIGEVVGRVVSDQMDPPACTTMMRGGRL